MVVGRAKTPHCFWLEMCTAEMRTGLLANLQIAVCLDETCSSKGWRITLRTLFFALTVYLSRLPWFSPRTYDDSVLATIEQFCLNG